MSIEIKRSDKYVDYNISATNNRGYITIDTSDWINKPWMFYELPALKFEIYTETDGELVKYQNFTREIRTYNPVYSPLGVLNVTIDIRNVPEEFILRITPIFDNDAVDARNMLVENGIEDGEIWGSDQDVPTQLFNLNLEFIECEGEYVPPTPPVPPSHQETITGIPPITFDGSTGEPLVSWTILGNSYQASSPTPNNPVTPTFCGIMTGNLLNINATNTLNGYVANSYLNASGDVVPFSSSTGNSYCVSEYIKVEPNKAYYFTDGIPHVAPAICEYDNQHSYITGKSFNSADSISITTNANTAYLRVSIYSAPVQDVKPMLNSGSTALQYEPFGYKIPISCGGENLWSEDYTGIDGYLKYVPVFVGNGTFTLSTDTPIYSASAAPLFLLSGNVTSGASTPDNGVYNGVSRTTNSSNGYVTIAFRRQSESSDPTTHKTMLNIGSTAKPYAPYSQQTTTVYLGQISTVRKILKLVLTGQETGWTENSSGTNTLRAILQLSDANENGASGYCSHTKFVTSGVSKDEELAGTLNGNLYLRIRKTIAPDITAFKQWLADEYANGTPVCVWYVLANEETGIINEPLCKIGDYADELSSTNAGVTIQTVDGDNVLTVDTDLQPSEITITYTKEGQ